MNINKNTNKVSDLLDVEKASTLREFEESLKNKLLYNMQEESFLNSLVIKELLEENREFFVDKKELRDQYEKIMYQSMWVGIDFVGDDEVRRLFAENLVPMLGLEEYDWLEYLRVRLLQFYNLKNRTNARFAWRKAMLGNKEKITNQAIVIIQNSGEKREEPTVANWLKLYNINLGMGEVEKVKRREFYTRDKNFKSLDEKEKAMLERLFDVYEYLKLPSTDLRVYEMSMPYNKDGELKGFVRGGKYEPIKNKEKLIEELKDAQGIINNVMKENGLNDQVYEWPEDDKRDKLDTKEKVEEDNKVGNAGDNSGSKDEVKENNKPKEKEFSDRVKASENMDNENARKDKKMSEEELFDSYNNYVEDEKMQKLIAKMEKAIEGIEGIEKSKVVSKMRNDFYNAINKKEKEKAMLITLVIFARNMVGDIFARDKRFVDFWSSQLEKMGGEVKEFENDPENKKHIAMFLKYIFVNRLKVGERESALFGALLSDVARQTENFDYQDMVYADLEEGEFVWNES